MLLPTWTRGRGRGGDCSPRVCLISPYQNHKPCHKFLWPWFLHLINPLPQLISNLSAGGQSLVSISVAKHQLGRQTANPILPILEVMKSRFREVKALVQGT
ncbi:unnamed protein product [Pipistrellus nathusii]|uniref:Uncharacterized protein n=1 Tax=Pipistrellus nathusii TaxID=59473 RepID=A0ABP0ABM9_PIPNA